ncbi:helix-turn-helix transcriptional regulator [Mitsuaria sp. CC2]|uniref:helix-turn-helix domain-containing protein n=1 Tax=Mitsuaria sp. CC2 TaxID=3029186 RepID=UPI003B8CB634
MSKSLNSRNNEIFLAMLRDMRTGRRMRQADLAALMGWGQATISKVESGERRLDIIELRDLVTALGLDFLSFVRSLEDELQRRGVVSIRLKRCGRHGSGLSSTSATRSD